MELIEGPNLEEAVKAKAINDWQLRLRVGTDLARIILTAHQVPERVLHRDIRPANIMLKNFFISPESWELVVLDFDLSWHRDASEGSLNLSRSMNGYLAPEQIDLSRKKLTRNALVDSFGVGMTLFYLATGQHPITSQHLHIDWSDKLKQNTIAKTCEEWHSLPRRFARLIYLATKDKQSDRWDMTQIQGELLRLTESLGGSEKVVSAELFAEEVACRSCHQVGEYTWDVDRESAY
jgi:eukaryotic-like serine/threonine-protein kinase